MPSDMMVALFSLIGTVSGSLLGIIASSRLTAYRIQQLEEKVEKHNRLIERTYRLEESTKSAHKRLDALEKK